MLNMKSVCFVIFSAIFIYKTEAYGQNVEQNVTELKITEVKEDDVNFFLYTRDNPAEFKEIFRDNLHTLDKNKHIKFIIHGWRGDSKLDWYSLMTKAYLKKGDYNIIQVDYKRISHTLYKNAVKLAKDVGRFIAYLIISMHKEHNIPLTNIHLIGFSLGGHVAGFTGKEVYAGTSLKIRRITGLDPAGPLFNRHAADPSKRLDKNDAVLVDVIHTDMGRFGYKHSLGTVDFWPNGGKRAQPGCFIFRVEGHWEARFLSEIFGCSHLRCPKLYINSIYDEVFRSVKCDSWKDFDKKKCVFNEFANMGDSNELSPNITGNFYLRTNKKYPYAQKLKVPEPFNMPTFIESIIISFYQILHMLLY